jgi:hypothetical protein
MKPPMQKWEYLRLTVMFSDNDKVKCVTGGGVTIFENVKMGVVLEYMDDLKSDGWEVVSVRPIELGETYELKKLVE